MGWMSLLLLVWFLVCMVDVVVVVCALELVSLVVALEWFE